MKNTRKQFNRVALLALVGSSIMLTACGRSPDVTGVSAGGGTDIAQPGLGGTAPSDNFTSPGGGYGGYDNQLPQVQQPDQPLDTPEPLPAPANPVQPGEPIILRAVANTTAFAVPRFSKYFTVNGVYVFVHLTWQPVNGAAEYWVYKSKIPHFTEARREMALAIVPAGASRSGFKDGLEAPNLKDGSFLDRVKRGLGAISNRPGIAYEYKVVAVDANGIPMSESRIEKSTALPAISSATLNEATDTKSMAPLFSWKDGQEAVRPQGYYVSVFPSVQFTQGTLPPTSLAFWTAYRPQGTNVVRYGKDRANQLSYASTLPFDINFQLGAGKQYSWSAVGILTDTGDMKTANAISRSWSGFGHFQIDPNAQPPAATNPQTAPTTGGNVSTFNAPRYNNNAYPQQQQQTGYAYPQQQQQTGYAYPQQQQQTGYAYPQQQQQTGYAYPQQQQQTGYAYPQQQQQQYPQPVQSRSPSF